MAPKLLTTKQYKLDKGKDVANIATFGIQLSPANSAGFGTICAMAGACTVGCISETGMNAFPTHRTVREKRTELYKLHPQAFHDQLQREIDAWKRLYSSKGFKLAARPNTLSDLPLLAKAVAERNPDLQVYDYTKLPKPASRRLSNYHLTYSYSERTTQADIDHCVEHKVNIAVILAVGRGKRLPKSVTLFGRTFAVIDGDKTDLRFKDPSDKAYVVGLRWKRSKDSQARLAAGIAAGLVIDPMAGACHVSDLRTAGASYRASKKAA